jgi:hypothetical protein
VRFSLVAGLKTVVRLGVVRAGSMVGERGAEKIVRCAIRGAVERVLMILILSFSEGVKRRMSDRVRERICLNKESQSASHPFQTTVWFVQ